jgi:hydrogenase nickel incorporation protein HypB
MTRETSENPAQSGEIAKRDFARRPPQAMIRAALARSGVLAVRIIGPPGSGKTELIEATLKALPGPRRVAVIAVDPASIREADRLQNLCGYVAHLDSAVPDPAAIWRIISQLRLEDFDFILIEGCGGMARLKDIGQDATAAVLAVSGGDDKALEYHAMLESASVILLSKIDVRQFVKFNEHVFRKDVSNIAPDAQIIELSAVTGSGMLRWFEWLDKARTAKKLRDVSPDPDQSSSNKYFG